jgi:hypothetical protein
VKENHKEECENSGVWTNAEYTDEECNVRWKQTVKENEKVQVYG